MRTRLICQCIGLLVCGLMMVACQTRPMVRLLHNDMLVYRSTASPLENMRLAAPPGSAQLEVHADGWARLRKAGPHGPIACEVRLDHNQVELFFTDFVDAHPDSLSKYPELSKEPLPNEGRLAPGGSLSAQIAGKTYEYYWLEGDFPAAAEPVRTPIFNLMKQLSPMCKPEE